MQSQSEVTELITTILQKYIKVGVISKIDQNKHTARVVFEEDENVSYDLPILCRNSIENKDYNLPDINEDVLCLMLPNGDEDGFILGSFYASGVELPTQSLQERKVKFNDDTEVIYNRETHNLDIIIENTTIKANRETVDINGAKTVHINATEEIVLTDTTKVIVNAPEVTINADNTCSVNTQQATITAQNVKIDAPITTITGNVTIQGSLSQGTGGAKKAGNNAIFHGDINIKGNVTGDSDIVASSISLTKHTHKENGKGSNTSKPS